ncbi:MAG: hypothetical protein ACO4AV_13400 [bacterium]
MKLKSELYIQELNALLYGINLQVIECTEILKKERRKTEILAFLMPWKAARLWGALSANAQILHRHVLMMDELRQKIFLSEGFDADMKPVTLEEICNTNDPTRFPLT